MFEPSCHIRTEQHLRAACTKVPLLDVGGDTPSESMRADSAAMVSVIFVALRNLARMSWLIWESPHAERSCKALFLSDRLAADSASGEYSEPKEASNLSTTPCKTGRSCWAKCLVKYFLQQILTHQVQAVRRGG